MSDFGERAEEGRSRLLRMNMTVPISPLDPDAFPASDLGLRKAAGLHKAEGGGTPVSTAELETMSQAWRPWRGYAALALWTI